MKMQQCPECGGWGEEPGSNFGDHGWHPCFRCGSSGKITEEEMAQFISEVKAWSEGETAGGESAETCSSCRDRWETDETYRKEYNAYLDSFPRGEEQEEPLPF